MVRYRKWIHKAVVFSLGVVIIALSASAQSTIVLPDKLVRAVIAEVSGDIALNNEMMLAPFERNRPKREYTGDYWETRFMLEKLSEYGFSDVHVEKFPSPRPQWDAVKGRLTVTSPFREKIADHDEVAAVLAGGSAGADLHAELVYVPRGTHADSYQNLDVTGKVVLSEGGIRSLYANAVNRFGAAGAVTYSTRYPDRYPNLIGWSSVSRGEKSTKGFGFMIRHPKGLELVRRLNGGEKIQVHAEVETETYPGKLEVVTAVIPGTDPDQKELLLIAHLFEGVSKQGANDNNSGVVCILETGRTILELMRRGELPPLRRTIRFLWVPEIIGTRAYIKKHPDEIRRILAGINMDMVGEDLYKTRSLFNVSRTPHSIPSFFNDIVQEFAELTVKLNNDAFAKEYGRLNLEITSPHGSATPFLLNVMGLDTGSDHQMFSNGAVRVPTVYFECWPDDFYHSSMDTPDKTDPTQLKRVAFIAAASMITAAQAGPDDAGKFVALVAGKGRRRIAEIRASVFNRLAVAGGNDIFSEYKWSAAVVEGAFLHEIENLETIQAVADKDPMVLKKIRLAVENLEKEKYEVLSALDREYGLRCEALGIPARTRKPTPEEARLGRLVPERKAQGMLERMESRLRPKLSRDHPVYTVRHAAAELADFIDGKRSVLEIARIIAAEFGGPDVESVGEYFDDLEKQGKIILRSKN